MTKFLPALSIVILVAVATVQLFSPMIAQVPDCDGSVQKTAQCTYTAPPGNVAPTESASCLAPDANKNCGSVIAYGIREFYCEAAGKVDSACPSDSTKRSYKELCRDSNTTAVCYSYKTCTLVTDVTDANNIKYSCGTYSDYNKLSILKVDGPCGVVCFMPIPAKPIPVPKSE